MIQPSDLAGTADEDRARKVLILARSIAPCVLDFADESEEKKNAVAILKGVLAELPAPGERRMRGLSRNGTSVTLDEVRSAFSEDDRVALRALCDATAVAGIPQGSFPEERLFERIWPGERYL